MPERPTVYRFNRAIVRRPGKSVVRGLRTGGGPDPSAERIAAEHAAYVEALEAAGVAVEVLPPLEDFPDSIFVEDPALVFSVGAILLRPGAESRAGETAEIEPVLRDNFETVLHLPEPGKADGGDILVTPSKVLIGLSARTDRAGAEGLTKCLEELGYKADIADTPPGVLHFKTACSLVDDETVLMTKAFSRSNVFNGYEQIIIPDDEEAAANALRINDAVFVGASFPKTIELLERRGYRVLPLPTDEINKIDAGLSCMSLRWSDKA